MFWKTYEAFQERLDYAKSADGTWVAEFGGPFRIKVTDAKLERCRHVLSSSKTRAKRVKS